jgi:hypothetical protein
MGNVLRGIWQSMARVVEYFFFGVLQRVAGLHGNCTTAKPHRWYNDRFRSSRFSCHFLANSSNAGYSSQEELVRFSSGTFSNQSWSFFVVLIFGHSQHS